MATLLAFACTDAGVRPTAVTVAADSADQVLFKMSTRITENGVLRGFVDADTAYLYQRAQTMDLRGFTVRLFDEQGNHKSTLTARTGLYQTFSRRLDARGGVVVVSTDGRKLRTEHLIYDPSANQISSDTTFVFDGPNEHGTGNGFLSDIGFANVTVQQPKGQQRGKGFLLPGQ
ncbi:MAG TPA: LPS export ABC transporter periplasmic protein LptC [Gemmatimonadales bacterium]|nr:LPS export ABC transporter periplasmic protein LptC [Gemmatimonadales bacterium]